MSEPNYDPLIRFLVQMVQIPCFTGAALCVFAIGKYQYKTRWWGWVVVGYSLLVVQCFLRLYGLDDDQPLRLWRYGVVPSLTGVCLFLGCYGYVADLWRKI